MSIYNFKPTLSAFTRSSGAWHVIWYPYNEILQIYFCKDLLHLKRKNHVKKEWHHSHFYRYTVFFGILEFWTINSFSVLRFWSDHNNYKYFESPWLKLCLVLMSKCYWEKNDLQRAIFFVTMRLISYLNDRLHHFRKFDRYVNSTSKPHQKNSTSRISTWYFFSTSLFRL